MKKSLNDADKAMKKLDERINQIEMALDKSKKQVSILEESIGPKDKRWARIKTIRNIIQRDILKNNLSNNLNINDITSISGSLVDYSEEFDVPISLIAAIMRTESAYNPSATSKAGARGLMQIMPGTAEEIASDIGIKYYNLYKITDNVRMGTFYVWKMLKRFKGNIELAIRSYNCGFIYTEKVLAGEYSDYPAETKQYVIKVLESKKLFEEAGL